MRTPALAPMRVAPASTIARAPDRSRTPPAAFTPIAPPTTRRMRATSATVAPPFENPVDVFTKSAPAAFASVQAVTFSSSVSSAASMMTLLVTPHGRHTSTTASMSFWTALTSPDFSAPMWITMSTSDAPSKIARRVSYAFTSLAVAPSGNPTTVHTPTPLPCSRRAARVTHTGLMHTVANRYSAASRQSASISARVASAFSSVWSISEATSPAGAPAACRPSRDAPASSTPRTRCGQHSSCTAWQ